MCLDIGRNRYNSVLARHPAIAIALCIKFVISIYIFAVQLYSGFNIIIQCWPGPGNGDTPSCSCLRAPGPLTVCHPAIAIALCIELVISIYIFSVAVRTITLSSSTKSEIQFQLKFSTFLQKKARSLGDEPKSLKKKRNLNSV